METVKEILTTADDISMRIRISGMNKADDCDPWTELYFDGAVQDVPNHLLNCEVLSVGRSFAHGCPIISIPYIK